MSKAHLHPIDEPLYSQEETARKLAVSVSTLARIRKREEIGYFRIGAEIKHCDHQIADYKARVEQRVS